MRRRTLRRAKALPPLLIATFGFVLLGAGPVVADALHRIDLSGTWRHEFSGWLFPVEIAGLKRIDVPYSLDGSDDVGAEYRSDADGVALKLEVHTGADSAPPAAGVTFLLDAAPGVQGLRAVMAGSAPALIHYRFRRENWTVSIVGTAPDPAAAQALDAVVNALPWSSLGSADRLHW